ncbi:MAG: putative porin [Flavobacteriaceae bacterium]
MNSIRPLFIALLLLVAFVVQSQNQPNSLPSQRLEGLGGGSKLNNQFQGPFQGQDSLFSNRSKERLTEKKPITDYLIISQSRDTSYVDTTLSVEKQYKFNFRRKDNFEYLAFANSGQTINYLSVQPGPQSILPMPGFRAKIHQMFQPDEVFYYHVPTPLTEMYFKTAFQQGQSTDVLITANLSPRMNYALAYRGHRSLGHYQHSLSGVSQLRFSTWYENPNRRYRLRFQMANQKIEQQENGGLDNLSLQNYTDKITEFEDRARLSVKFQNATNFFTGKRYLLEQDYALIMTSDSIPLPALRLGYRIQTDSQRHTFDQQAAVEEFGSLAEGYTTPKDQLHYTNTRHDVYALFEQSKWGQIEAYASALKYSYNNVHTSLDHEVNESGIAVGGKLGFSLQDSQWKFHFEQSADDNLLGSFAQLTASFPKIVKVHIQGGFRWETYFPRFTLLNYHSSYSSFIWQKSMLKTNRSTFFSSLDVPKLGLFSVSLTTLDNYGYFQQNFGKGSLFATPEQWDETIHLLKARWDNRLSLGVFSLDTNIQFQQVDNNAPIHLPDLLGRSTVSYADEWFRKAAFVQIGATVKYYSSFYADAYSSILSDYVVQDAVKIGGEPLFSAFFNAKIRQTRLYFNAENLGAAWNGNNRLAAPDHPYRDFILRFGIVWNFFQ